MTTDTLATLPADDQVVPSLHHPDMGSPHHPHPRHDTITHSAFDVPMFATQSPDLPYPRHQQQRAYSVTTVPNELQHSILGRERQAAEHQRRPQHEQPWWQHYYQLYQYHPLPGRKPTMFGPYLLLQTLGEGEFGKVKLAVQIETGQEVAIKLIKKDNIDSTTRMSKIEREISVLRTVRHPYIVNLYDVIETERYIGIILQWASGGELFEYILAHRYLKEKDAKRLFAELISGVHYMHQKNIVHRDLKLENLLLDKNKSVIITDFGFANQITPGQDDLMSTSCGSPCYAAPELVISEGMYVGSAVDIWSCGVILYAMLCGYLPFDDDPANPDSDNINLLYKYILNTKLSFPNYVSQEARDLLCKMLVPDPAKRCTMDTIMQHPWLSDYRPLFAKSITELEMEAMATADMHMVVTEPARPTAAKPNEERRKTYAAPPRTADTDIPETKEDHVKPANDAIVTERDKDEKQPKDDTTATSSSNETNHAMDIDEQTVPPSSSPPKRPPSVHDATQKEEQETVDKEDSVEVKMASPEPSLMTASESGANNAASSIERPTSTHTNYSSSMTDRDATSEKRSVHTDSRVPRPVEFPRPSSSPSTKKRGAEKILSFLSGSTSSIPSRSAKKGIRPFSMTMDNRTSPGNSILHAKFLSSMHRVHDDSTGAGIPGPITGSLSTPQTVHAPPPSLTAAATRLSGDPSRIPRPTIGLSQPTRSRRPKTLSLLVNPMSADKDTVKMPFRRQQPATNGSKPAVMVTESTSSVVMHPSQSEQYSTTALPLSPTSPDARLYKQKSAGKKFMDWFKAKPQNAKEPMSTPRGVPFGKPPGSYATDYHDAKLRTHHGAVDQIALTSRPPQEVFVLVRQTLISMGIDVKNDGEYKLKCARRKRPAAFGSVTTLNAPSATHLPAPAATPMPGRPHPADKKRRMSANAPKLRMLLRRGSHTTPAVPSATVVPSGALYGDPVVDPGEEVRFSVELCKIKNLPGLYIVDVRRMRGNVWSYKHLYHAVLAELDLTGKGGYMATRAPNQGNEHLSPQMGPDRLSTASSQDSSLFEHKEEA